MKLTRILALFGLVAAIFAAAATTAGAATLKAPVIKEKFTPLGCKKGDQTTLGMEGCYQQKILAGDTQINALNAKIFAAMDTTGKRDFIAGHNAWLKYRGAYCASESDVYEGGTEAGVVDAACTANVNAAHVRELKDFASDLSQD